MWDVMSYDFNRKVSKEKCLNNVLKSAKPGSIIVFHDSIKAADNMLYALPQVFKKFHESGFVFKAITT
jgi:hypothetical protein